MELFTPFMEQDVRRLLKMTGINKITVDKLLHRIRFKFQLPHVTKKSPEPTHGFGRIKRGDKRCKLTGVLVRDIRNAHDAGESIRSLAIHYELSTSTVWKIVKRHIWKTLN